MVLCIDGTFVGIPPSCQLKCMSQPQPPTNGYLVYAAPYTPGDQIEFGCDAGFTLSAESLYCMDGQLSGVIPRCLGNCDSQPPAPAHGAVVTSPPYESSATVNFTCDDGFLLVPSPVSLATPNDSLAVTCSNGTFTGNVPWCVPISPTTASSNGKLVYNEVR